MLSRSQGGAEFPTGGSDEAIFVGARERFVVRLCGKGQQIWFDARADGYSPDKRESHISAR